MSDRPDGARGVAPNADAVRGPELDTDVGAGRSGQGRDGGSLLHRVSRSMFWNTLLLPLITFLNVVMAVIIRRHFGLGAGIYDGLMGVLHTVMLYSGLGIPTSLTKFLPEQEVARGRSGVVSILWKAASVRVFLLMLAVLPLALQSGYFADVLSLGERGALYLRLLSLLIVLRALLELVIKTLHAFLAQLWVNLLFLLQAILEPALVALALTLGFGMGGVVGALIAAGTCLCVIGAGLAKRTVRKVCPEPVADAASRRRYHETSFAGASRFALFTYVYELSLYFGGVNFARTALLSVLASEEPVALFSAGFKVAFMVVVLVVSGFQGVYRPLFTRLCSLGDRDRLRAAFTAVTKVQVFLLLPAGVGLGVMVGDYMPLLFSPAYLPAVPLARVLVATLFSATAFNLGIIILSVDERYRPVLACQFVYVLGAPAFVATAAMLGLLPAAAVLGLTRLVAVVAGHRVARRIYGVRFPWTFTFRAALVAIVMGLVLAAARTAWPTSVVEAMVLTMLGVAIFVVGTRLAGVLGAEERDLLRQAQIPGGSLMIRLLGIEPSSDSTD